MRDCVSVRELNIALCKLGEGVHQKTEVVELIDVGKKHKKRRLHGSTRLNGNISSGQSVTGK